MKEQQAFVSLTNCVIRKCRAKLGAAILAHTSTSGTLTIQDTDINWCVNMVDGKDADWAINGGTIRSWANSSVMLNMKNVKMHHNYSHMNAGALYWNAMRDDDTYATVDGCVFAYNYARGGGGACFICGPLEFCGNETVVCRNTCKGETGESKDHGDGGGICVQVYSAEAAPHHAVNLHSMFGSCLTVYENTAKRGGGISYYYGDSSLYDGSALQLIVNGCKIYNNSASELGGGLYVENAEQNKNRIDFAFDFNSGIISNNMSAAEGGGVYISGGAVTFTGGQVVNNASATRGGGLFIKDCTADILVNTNGSRLLVADNVAMNGGGLAIWGTKVDKRTVTLDAGMFAGNHANDGGGIYITNALLSATGGNVISNAAIRGGGICLGVDGHATFDGTMNVSYNVATNLGGGVAMNYNSTLSITNGTFSFNQAQMGGGAHLLGGAKLTIIGGDFFCNRAVYREGTDLVHVGSRGQTSSTNWPTAWHTERYDLCSGVGGGIYLGKGSDGKLTTLDCPKNDRVGIVGAYSNIADRAGNEIVSAGLYTKVNLPNRVLTNEVGQILTWFEDYYTNAANLMVTGTPLVDTHGEIL